MSKKRRVLKTLRNAAANTRLHWNGRENGYRLIMIDRTIGKGNKRTGAIQSDGRPSNRIRLTFLRVWRIFWPSVCASKIVPRIVDIRGLWRIFREIPPNSILCRRCTVAPQHTEVFFFIFFHEFRTSPSPAWRVLSATAVRISAGEIS